MPLKLTLFGAPVAAVHTTLLHFRTDKIRALLVYLALENERPHERHALAALLWPDMPEQTALKNLRQSLHRLQQTLDESHPGLSDSLFQITRQTIRCAPAALDVDVLAFQGLLDTCEAHPHRHLHLCQDCLTRLADAVSLYRAEFLAGFGLSDAFAFEEWMFFWRERLQQQVISALEQLANALAERGEIEAALPYTTRLVALDPFREEAHRLLMRLFARHGQHGKALAQYETCRRTLKEELGVDPAAETTLLYRQIQAEQGGERAPSALPAPTVLHHFPVQFTPFAGREGELQQVEEWFLDPDSRLMTLVGPGGVGKTRLAIRAGEHLATKGGLTDGIYFFSLAAIRTPEALLTTLLDGLGAATSARHTPQASLLNHLRDRQCLLVLDNFEQLSASAPLLGEMLATAPGLRLLVSSQLLLNLRAERRLAVNGLDYPSEGELVPNPMSFSAVRLFVEAARQVDASFRLSPENEQAVLKICQLVEGLPLALELAAAWVRLMSPQAIVREIERSLDFLSLSPQDHPERHQSMGAVFANAWQLLPPAEQTVLAQLGVFRGPFHLEAALDITEATPLTLARLLDRSLLQRRKDGLYELHELLRQFVRQQTPPTRETARRHGDYYLNLLAAQEKAFIGPHPRQAIGAIQRILSNVRQAWQWAVEQQDWPAIERSYEGLGRFYQTAALLQEGEVMFAQANAQFGENPGLLVWQAYFLHKLGRQADALRLANRALDCAGEAKRARADIHSLLGELLPREGQLEPAKAYQKQAIEYFQATSDLNRLARALRRMALTCWRGGDHDEAMRYFQRAIPIHEALQEKRGLAQLYNVLAGIYYERNDLAQALVHVQKAQALYEAIEDKLDAAVVSANLARLYTHLGQFEQALASNQRAVDISQELGDRSGLARDLSNRGYILSVVGELDQSLDFYFRALDIARVRNDREHIAEFQAGIAAVYALKGDDETALVYYDLALPVLQAQGVPYHLVGPLLGKAELLYRRGEWAKAKSLVTEAKTLSQDIELAEYLHQSHILTAKLDYAEGNPSAGLQQLAHLLAETEDETAQASLHYELWQLTRDRASAEAARTGYENVCLRTPSFIHRRRLEELRKFLA